MQQVVCLVLLVAGFSMNCSDCKPVMFIFGDSLSDAGNNQHLARSLARASLPWYGIDFGNGLPNGRFTNGRTVADIMGDAMGLPRPLAFLDPTLNEDVILDSGVNYASGGAGILNETGGYFLERFWFRKQIELFRGTQVNVTKKIGKQKSDKFFQNAVYFVAFGSNDFINNFLMPVYRDSWTYNDNSFMNYLIGTFRDQLKVGLFMLHTLGARKMMVLGLGPLGCIPLQRVLTSTGECQNETNNVSYMFNQAASEMVREISTALPNASFQFADSYDFVSNLISDPLRYGNLLRVCFFVIGEGFENSESPCCSFGRIRPALTCTPASELCKVRSKYVFWDEYHPSDAANQFIANELLTKFGLPRSG
ncbi:hypothetical protein V2J09_019482 [Rumex salicifolius]